MLLWLEEAAIEIAMILAVAVGSFMFVAAVWSAIHKRLHPNEEQRRDQAPVQRTAASGVLRTSAIPPSSMTRVGKADR